MNPFPEIPASEINEFVKQLNYNSDKFAHQVILERDNQKVLLFAFAMGQELKTHTTPKPAVLIMLEGSCLFNLDGASQILTSGQAIVIPADVPHSLTAASTFKMILVK